MELLDEMNQHPERFSGVTVSFAVIILVFLPELACKFPASKCSMGDPLPIFHKSFKSGDIIITGIMSQIYIFSNHITFRRYPSQELIDDIT